jgi:hypothetical protein
VVSSFDPGALLSQTYTLPRGPRVRLRLAQRRDEPAIRALLAQRGREPEDFETMRLVRFDPRERAVICATALIGAAETVVGLGAIEIDPEAAVGPDHEPDLLVVDKRITDGLDDLLRAALRGRAVALARARAA